jgi:HK97 family phage major capsid protein
MFPRARKITTARRSIRIPALDQTGTPAKAYQPEYYGGVVAKWTEEAGTKSETEPDFKQIEMVLHKLAGYTQASDELVDDSVLSIDQLLRQLFGGAVRFRRDYAYLRGTGIGQPLGILNSGALLTTARDVANQVSANDLHSMLSIFLPTSMGRGVWVASPGTMEFMLALSDGTNYIWQPDAKGDIPGRLYGMPLIWSEKLPWLGTTGDVLLIDPMYYYIATSGGLAIDVSEHYAFINDLTTWRFVFRTDGQPCLSGPIYIDTTHTVSPFVALLNTTD